MVSNSQQAGNVSPNHWRILIAASDAELVTDEVLELEKQTILESMEENGDNELVVKTISTLHQAEFITTVSEFKPNIVQFTRRGSVEPYIRMLDSFGVLRRITGRTLAKLLAQANCYLSFTFLMNCELYRERNYVLSYADYIVSIKSEQQTHELPYSLTREIYMTLGRNRDAAGALNGIASYVTEKWTGWPDVIRISTKDIPPGITAPNRQYFEHWTATKSISDNSVVEKPLADSFKSSHGLAKLENDGPKLYRVWFGTNRNVSASGGVVSFGSKRSDRIRYGYCDVAIPKYHRIGTLGAPWWKRFPYFWRNNRLAIYNYKVLAINSYFSKLKSIFAELPDEDQDLLVFFHGYNVNFNDAALRAAQLGFDLGVRGATAFFSWPSKGSISGYAADIASIEASEKHIVEFLEAMSERSGAKRIHLIAHSMGNRGLLRAFSTMVNEAQKRVGKSIQQVFLAAPDVDTDLFCNLANVYQDIATRTTMYVSSKDWALTGSGIIHSYERAGYTPPVTVVRGIDTIEVSNIDLTLLGHGYVADAKEVLVDMHTLMSSDVPPSRRFGLIAMKNDDLEDYWLMPR